MGETTKPIGDIINRLPTKQFFPYLTTLIILSFLGYGTFLLFFDYEHFTANPYGFTSLGLFTIALIYLFVRFGLRRNFSDNQKFIQSIIEAVDFPIILYKNTGQRMIAKYANADTANLFDYNDSLTLYDKDAMVIYDSLESKLSNFHEWRTEVDRRLINATQNQLKSTAKVPMKFKEDCRHREKEMWILSSTPLNINDENYYFTIITPIDDTGGNGEELVEQIQSE